MVTREIKEYGKNRQTEKGLKSLVAGFLCDKEKGNGFYCRHATYTACLLFSGHERLETYNRM
ncbi:MAG: hypothetical protein ACYCZO_02855 [Daejeonella sp.]